MYISLNSRSNLLRINFFSNISKVLKSILIHGDNNFKIIDININMHRVVFDVYCIRQSIVHHFTVPQFPILGNAYIIYGSRKTPPEYSSFGKFPPGGESVLAGIFRLPYVLLCRCIMYALPKIGNCGTVK